MDWHARVRDALAGARDLPDADVVDELADHLAALYLAVRSDGGSHEDAVRRAAAQIELWRRDAARLRRPLRRPLAVEPPPAALADRLAVSIARDVRYAARLLTRQPGFSALAVITMALGIGVSAVLFSVTWAVVFKPLPWPNADRLVALQETRGGLTPRFLTFTNAAYLAWQEEPRTLDALAAWSTRVVTLTGPGEPERMQITAATASLFRALGVVPIAGSLFADQDETSPVVVVSESVWRERLGGAAEGIGQSLTLDGIAHTVVGVLADRVGFPDSRSRAWVPFVVPPPSGNHLSMFHAVGTLRPGVAPVQAAAEGTARGRFVADTGLTTRAIFGGDGPVTIEVTPIREVLAGDVRGALLMLLGAAGLLVAIAVNNVAGLQVSRLTVRRRELAIRAALGAGRGALLRQLAAESLLLAAAGGGAGLLLAWAAHAVLPSLLPADFPRAPAIVFDTVVVLFAAAVALVGGLGFGVLPAVGTLGRASGVPLGATDAPPTDVRTASRPARARLVIMATQVAAASVLLVAAGLLGRTFLELLGADRGFDPSAVLSARLSMPGPAFTPDRRHRILADVVERLDGAPGVRAVGFTSEHPLSPGGSTSAFDLTSRSGRPVHVQASPRLVSAGYFSALGLPVTAGRPFVTTDTMSSPRVAVVNEAFANRYLERDAVGAKLPAGFWGGDDRAGDATIVGVVPDVKYVGGPERSQPEMYFLLEQAGRLPDVRVATLLLRAEGSPRSAAPRLREAVRAADAGVAVDMIMTLDERLRATSLLRPRLYATVLATFAACAVIITGVGLFGVLSFVVSQRTRELGIRAALGATRGQLVALVVAQGVGAAFAGTAVGLLAAATGAPALAGLLYEVAPGDPVIYVTVAAGVLAVAALACVVPAWRAAHLDPAGALRAGD